MKKSIILVFLLIIALSSCAFAETQISLGSSAVNGYNSSSNSYEYVYFGKDNNGNPIKWRVLDTTSNDGSTPALFMLSEYTLEDRAFRSDSSQDDSNQWDTSDMKTYLQGEFISDDEKFISVERNAILVTTKTEEADVPEIAGGVLNATNLRGEKVFLLSANEAMNTRYGFLDENGNDENRNARSVSTPTGSLKIWWLRSPNSTYSYFVGCVYEGGAICGIENSDCNYGVRPALNLNPSSILFTASAGGGIRGVPEGSGVFLTETTVTAHEITLLDTSRKFKATSDAIRAKQGTRVSIPYTGATIGANEYVSIMIVKDGEPIFYTKMINTDTDAEASGTLSFPIPASLEGGKYTIKVFSEQYNGSNKTGYASNFTDIELTIPKPDASGANAPDLYDGALKPITFDENGEAVIHELTYNEGDKKWYNASSEEVEWYNYDEKQWANAVTVDSSGNITGYYVWIPRYAYSVNSGYHTSTVGLKKILFLQGTSNRDIEGRYHSTLYESVDYIGDRQLEYLVHPAFSYGGNISGFWMAKYETSKNASGNIRILPGQSTWRSVSIATAFDKIKGSGSVTGMKDLNAEYGLAGSTADPHLLKNVEWGAMAYLTASKYGKESEEVWINNHSKYVTGMGSAVSASAGGTSTSSLLVDYKTPVNGKIQQSTTGNIYGIYDTNGGAWEYVAGYINTRDQYNNEIDPVTEKVIMDNGANLFNAEYKYKDLYKRSTDNEGEENYNLASSKKGDGVWETSSTWFSKNSFSWFGDYSYMPNTYYPFFVRSGFYNYGTKSGIFSFMCMSGASNSMAGFRVAIAKNL